MQLFVPGVLLMLAGVFALSLSPVFIILLLLAILYYMPFIWR